MTRDHTAANRDRDYDGIASRLLQLRLDRAKESKIHKERIDSVKSGSLSALFSDKELKAPESKMGYEKHKRPERLRDLEAMFPPQDLTLTQEEKVERTQEFAKMNTATKRSWVKMEEQAGQVCDIMHIKSGYDPDNPNELYWPHHYKVMEIKNGERKISKDKVTAEWIKLNFHPDFLLACRMRSGEWLPVPLGDFRPAADPNTGTLETNVSVRFIQKEGENHCLFYSVASTLWYLGYKRAAKALQAQAVNAENAPSSTQLKQLMTILRLKHQQFGRHVKYNRPTSNGGTRTLDLGDLFLNGTARPIVAIPLGNDGSVTHAVCIIDFLVFDSTQPKALRLCRETIDSVCGDPGSQGIWEAYSLEPYQCVPQKRKVRQLPGST